MTVQAWRERRHDDCKLERDRFWAMWRSYRQSHCKRRVAEYQERWWAWALIPARGPAHSLAAWTPELSLSARTWWQLGQCRAVGRDAWLGGSSKFTGGWADYCHFSRNAMSIKAESFVVSHTSYWIVRWAVRDRLRHCYLVASSKNRGSTVAFIISRSEHMRG